MEQALKAMERQKDYWKRKFESMDKQILEKAREVAHLEAQLESERQEAKKRADIIAALGLDEISQQLKDDLVDQLNTNDGSSSVAMTSQFSAESGKETATQFSVKSDTSTTVAQERINGIYKEMEDCRFYPLPSK